MIATLLAAAAFLLAAIPALLFLANLRLYRPAPRADLGASGPSVSVLIPARDEEESIGPAIESALANRGVALEVIVLDDHSRDRTAAIVEEWSGHDPRVRLIAGPELPPGWCGKQHACAVLAESARHDRLAFLDADVRLGPEALARMIAFLDASGADLVSGVPLQETRGLLERLVLPLIHFVLLGFLPIGRMRADRHPAYAAGCGQLFLVRRAAYELAGGHAAIRGSLHDGITLPRAFRAAGLATDLFDATDLATCRMYRGAGPLWQGLAKNATEGLASPALIGPATLLLLGGQVGPIALLAASSSLDPPAIGLAIVGTFAAYLPRLVAARRFRQSWIGALFHPVGILVLLVIQWSAFARSALGHPATWKGRPYPSRPPEPRAAFCDGSTT